MRTAMSMLVASIVVATTAVIGAANPASANQIGADQLPGIAQARAGVWDPNLQREVMVPPAVAQQIVIDYWTPERMSEAQPVDTVVTDTETEPTEQLGAEQTIADPASGDDAGMASGAHFSYANGKVFFIDPRDLQPYSCSGGAVNSGSKRLVVTAGHCVHPGDGGDDWMLNWLFVPGYQRGSQPRGVFPAFGFFASTGWTENARRGRDFAFVTTYTNAAGRLLVNAVGGHGLVIYPGRPYVHIAGYPVNRDNGEVQWNCWGTTSIWSPPYDPGQKLACGWRAGASGGPWLRDFGPSGVGYVISNMHGHSGNNNYGPYYNGHTGDIYAAAANVTP